MRVEIQGLSFNTTSPSAFESIDLPGVEIMFLDQHGWVLFLPTEDHLCKGFSRRDDAVQYLGEYLCETSAIDGVG